MYKKALLSLGIAGAIMSFSNTASAERSLNNESKPVFEVAEKVGKIGFEKTFESYDQWSFENKLLAIQKYLNNEIEQAQLDKQQAWSFQHSGITDVKNGKLEGKIDEFVGINKMLEETLSPEYIINRSQADVIKETLEKYKSYHLLLIEQKERMSNMNKVAAKEQLARYLVMKSYLNDGKNENWQLKELNNLNRQLNGDPEVQNMLLSYEKDDALNIYYENRLIIKPLVDGRELMTKKEFSSIFSIEYSVNEAGELTFSYNEQEIVQKVDGVYLLENMILEGQLVEQIADKEYIDFIKVLTLYGFTIEKGESSYSIIEPKQSESILLKIENEKIIQLLMAHL